MTSPFSTAEKFGKKLPFVLLGLLIVLFSILYLATIDRAGFWLDEVSTVVDLRKGYMEMVTSRALAGHGPVYFSLMWPWYRVTGDSEWLLRLPAMVAWFAIVATSAYMVRKYASPWLAVLVVLLLLLNPTLVSLAQLARPHALSALFVLLGLAWTLRAENHPAPSDALVLAVFSALALNTHFSTAIPLTGQLFYLLLRRQPVWLLAGGILVGFLAALPVLLHLSEHGTVTAPISWLWKASLYDLLQLPMKLAIGRVPQEWYLLTPFLSGLAIWGGLTSGRLGRLLLFVWASAVLFVTFLIAIDSAAIGSIRRYFGVAAVAQTILMALALKSGTMNIRIATAVAILLVLLLGWHLHRDLTTWNYPDWRQALRFVQQHSKGNQLVYALGDEKDLFQFDYYRNRLSLSAQTGHMMGPGGIKISRPPQLDSGTRRIVVVLGARAARIFSRNSIGRITKDLVFLANPALKDRARLNSGTTVGRIHILEYTM